MNRISLSFATLIFSPTTGMLLWNKMYGVGVYIIKESKDKTAFILIRRIWLFDDSTITW